MRILNVFVSFWCVDFFPPKCRDNIHSGWIFTSSTLIRTPTSSYSSSTLRESHSSPIPVLQDSIHFGIQSTEGLLHQNFRRISRATTPNKTGTYINRFHNLKTLFFSKLPPFLLFPVSTLGIDWTGNKKNTPLKFTNTLHRVWIHFFTIGKPTISCYEFASEPNESSWKTRKTFSY